MTRHVVQIADDGGDGDFEVDQHEIAYNSNLGVCRCLNGSRLSARAKPHRLSVDTLIPDAVRMSRRGSFEH